MHTLKKAQMSPLVLALTNSTSDINLHADACTDQVGCVFLRKQEDETTKPRAYRSSSLTDSERHYDTTQRESLAIVCAVLLSRPYLKGMKLTIRMDHESLKWILNHTESTGKITGWRLPLS